MNEPQNQTHRVLAQADALMRRHRVFIAGNATATAPDENSADQEDDFPVLTEVVADEAQQGSDADPTPPGLTEAQVQEMLAAQQQEFQHVLAQWLDEKLPDEVLRVMDGVSDQLIGALTTRMRNEFLPQVPLTQEPPTEIIPPSGRD
jgi:hypothetical protein